MQLWLDQARHSHRHHNNMQLLMLLQHSKCHRCKQPSLLGLLIPGRAAHPQSQAAAKARAAYNDSVWTLLKQLLHGEDCEPATAFYRRVTKAELSEEEYEKYIEGCRLGGKKV